MVIRIIYMSILGLLIVSCSGENTNNSNNGNPLSGKAIGNSHERIKEIVTDSVYENGTAMFSFQLACKGRVKAAEYADLYFRSTEIIANIWVKNGDYVRKGDKIAQLDLFALNNSIAQCKNNLAQATLEMQDVLIGQGYNPSNADAIPENILKLAKIKSGYEQREAELQMALHTLEQATIVAPYDGIIANMFGKQHNLSQTSEPLCRIISRNVMKAEFSIIETELSHIKIGKKVLIIPNASHLGEFEGTITEINPLVDENGMVKVFATIKNGNRLNDGMGINVTIEK